MKKIVMNVCRFCGHDFQGRAGAYRCPNCRRKEQQYKAQREKAKRSLPFYLKADM